MRSRSPVVISGLIFATLALLGYQLFGWKLDGWVLALGGMVHLGVVLRTYPRLDAFLVLFHYLVTLGGLAGIGWVLVDVVESPEGTSSVLMALLVDQWSSPASYAVLAGYVLLVTAIFLFLMVILRWLLHRKRIGREGLLAGLFVASLLNIPCDFAITDALSQMVVLDPKESGAFVFAVGIQSLVPALILHGLLLLTFAASQGWSRKRSAPLNAVKDEGSLAGS